MRFLPVPDFSFRCISDIGVAFLSSQGITLLLLDLDNTMAKYSESEPSEALLNWVSEMKKGGIGLFIVSNNRSGRTKNFAAALDIDYINRAKKPSVKGLLAAMEKSGAKPGNTAMVGDQIYTDVAAGKRCGVKTILLHPLSLKNPILAARYAAEFPFRAAGKKKV